MGLSNEEQLSEALEKGFNLNNGVDNNTGMKDESTIGEKSIKRQKLLEKDIALNKEIFKDINRNDLNAAETNGDENLMTTCFEDNI